MAVGWSTGRWYWRAGRWRWAWSKWARSIHATVSPNHEVEQTLSGTGARVYTAHMGWLGVVTPWRISVRLRLRVFCSSIPKVHELERFQTAIVSFKITRCHSYWCIRQATRNWLLVFHCNCVFILYRFRDIVTYLAKFKKITWLWTHPYLTIIDHGYTNYTTHRDQCACVQIWRV